MATGAGTIIGTAVGGPLGGAVGATIGSIIDQQVFMQKSSAGENADPILDDIRVSTASEGVGIPFLLGRRVRVAGTFIWISTTLEERAQTEVVGGKGGDEDEIVVGYEYFASFAVAWGTNGDGDIQFIQKIFASGNLWYKRETTLTFADKHFSILPVGGGTEGELTAETSDVDLRRITLGTDVTLSDFSEVNNNGTFQTIAKWSADSKTKLRMRRSDGLAFASDIELTATVTQTAPNFRPGYATSVKHYTGQAETQDWSTFIPSTRDAQPQNTQIESEEGLAIGFREIAYTAFEGFNISVFGNSIPNLSAIIDSTGQITYAQAIEKIWERTGRPLTEIDTTDVGTALFSQMLGYSIIGPQSIKEQLRPILLAGGIRVRETNGKLIFFDQGQEDTATISTGELGTASFGSQAPKLLRIFDPSTIEIPAQSEVKYIDAEKDFQRGAAIERGFIGLVNTNNVLTLDFPIAMTNAQARKIGRREMWNILSERQRGTFTLPPSRLEVTVGDKLTLTVPISNDPAETSAESYEIVVSQIDRGNDLIHEMQGFVEDAGGAEITDNPDANEDPVPPDDEVQGTSNAILELMDIPALGDSVVNQGGFYWAVALGSLTEQFRGAVLYESPDDSNFTSVATANVETVLGFATTVLADSAAIGWIDAENTVDVVVFHGTLSGITETALLAGQNLAILGSEIIAFRTATLISTGVYRLSNIVRGARDTEDQTGTHAVNERFVLLQSSTLLFKMLNFSDRGLTKFYRAVPAGGAVADAVSTQITHNNQTLVPFAPTDIRAARANDGGTPDEITIRWLRRTRQIVSFFSFADPPILESSERYEIDVYDDNTFTTLVATKAVTIAAGSLPSYVYSEADQTTDGLTPGDPLNVDIFQMSDNVGRGKARRATDI